MPVKLTNLTLLFLLFVSLYYLVKFLIFSSVSRMQSSVDVSEVIFKKESESTSVEKYKTSYSYGHFLEKIESDQNLLKSFLEILRGTKFKAYYFETPKIEKKSLYSKKFEFVLVDAAKQLENVNPDEHAFQEYFHECASERKSVTSFLNLGGDALLVAPCPNTDVDTKSYSHLAPFVRNAPKNQILEFWSESAKQALKHIKRKGSHPTWMSTCGTGVYWLHLRLDSRPKYYSYDPYT